MTWETVPKCRRLHDALYGSIIDQAACYFAPSTTMLPIATLSETEINQP